MEIIIPDNSTTTFSVPMSGHKANRGDTYNGGSIVLECRGAERHCLYKIEHVNP